METELDESALSYEEFPEAVAVIVHVPVPAVIVTSPENESTVHAFDVDAE